MTHFRFFCFILIFTLTKAQAGTSPQQDFARGFASPRVEFLTDDSPYVQPQPGQLSPFMKRIFRWMSHDPERGPQNFSAECHPDRLSENLAKTPRAFDQVAVVDQYFLKCDKEITTGVHSGWRNALEIMSIRYPVLQHPFLSQVMIHLPGNVHLKGILALKGDRLKRPLVILRLGIFSTVEGFIPERFLAMQYFEEGPSNVLIIENSSGADYVANNPGFTLGGPMEGLQNIQLAKILRDPKEPLSSLVGSLHLVGISLGGNGLFHAAALDAYQGKKTKPLFESYVGVCPVVHLEKTLNRDEPSAIKATLVDIWMAMRLAGLRTRISALAETNFGTWWKGIPYFWPAALKFAEQSYPATPGLSEGIRTPPEYSKPFWEAGEPWGMFKNIRAPFFVLSTKEDDLVPIDLNSRLLKKEFEQTTENLGVEILGEGFHCTLPAGYHWPVISSLLNGQLKAHTLNDQDHEEHFDVDLGDVIPASAADKNADTKLTNEVDWSPGTEEVILKIHVLMNDRSADFAVNLPRNEFDFQFLNAVLSSPEKKMLERWIGQNLRMELFADHGHSFLRLKWRRHHAAFLEIDRLDKMALRQKLS